MIKLKVEEILTLVTEGGGRRGVLLREAAVGGGGGGTSSSSMSISSLPMVSSNSFSIVSMIMCNGLFLFACDRTSEIKALIRVAHAQEISINAHYDKNDVVQQ